MKKAKSSKADKVLKVGTETENSDDGLITEEVTAEEKDFENKLQELLGHDCTVRIEQESVDGTKWEKIPQDFKLDNFDINSIASKLGGGKFKIRVTEKGVFRGQTTLTFKRMPVSEATEKKENSQDIINIIMQQNNALQAQQLELIKAISGKTNNQGLGVSEVIQLFATLKGLGGKEANIQDILGSIESVMSLTEKLRPEIGGGGGDISPEKMIVAELIKNIAPKILGWVNPSRPAQQTASTKVEPSELIEKVIDSKILEPVKKVEVADMITYVSEFEGKLFESLNKDKTKILGLINSGFISPDMAAEYLLKQVDEAELYDYLKEYGVKRIVTLIKEFTALEVFFTGIEQYILSSFVDDAGIGELVKSEIIKPVEVKEYVSETAKT